MLWRNRASLDWSSPSVPSWFPAQLFSLTKGQGTTALVLTPVPSLLGPSLCSGHCLLCFPDVAPHEIENSPRSPLLRFGSTWSRENFWVKCVLALLVFPLCKCDGARSRWRAAGLCCLPGGCSLTPQAEVRAIPVRGCCLSCVCHWSTAKPEPRLWVYFSPRAEGWCQSHGCKWANWEISTALFIYLF